MIGGDFNMVLHMHERSGGGTSSREVEKFRDMLDYLEVVDLPQGGGRWTWSNSRITPSWSRIDHFFISNGLLM